MTKKERASFVITTLKELYPTIPIPLDHKDAYTLLIAVLLSAQCTDVRVNQITPLLFAKADNIASNKLYSGLVIGSLSLLVLAVWQALATLGLTDRQGLSRPRIA